MPVTLDPRLRLISDSTQFATQLQALNAHIGSENFPIIRLVPFSNTLSVPRMSKSCIALSRRTGLTEGEAKQRHVLHSSLIASNIEHELHNLWRVSSLLVHLTVLMCYWQVALQVVTVFHWLV